jgi:hypothetical protein
MDRDVFQPGWYGDCRDKAAAAVAERFVKARKCFIPGMFD